MKKYKLTVDNACSFCFNPDSTEHCNESASFFTKTLRWFNDYHNTKIKLSKIKQNLFNTLEDSIPFELPSSHKCRLR